MMQGQVCLPYEKMSRYLQVETGHAASSQDVASQRRIRFLWTMLGATVLMVIGVPASALHPLASHASEESSRLVPEVAFNPTSVLGPRGFRPSRDPGIDHARSPASRASAAHAAVMAGSRPASLPETPETHLLETKRNEWQSAGSKVDFKKRAAYDDETRDAAARIRARASKVATNPIAPVAVGDFDAKDATARDRARMQNLEAGNAARTRPIDTNWGAKGPNARNSKNEANWHAWHAGASGLSWDDYLQKYSPKSRAQKYAQAQKAPEFAQYLPRREGDNWHAGPQARKSPDRAKAPPVRTKQPQSQQRPSQNPNRQNPPNPQTSSFQATQDTRKNFHRDVSTADFKRPHGFGKGATEADRQIPKSPPPAPLKSVSKTLVNVRTLLRNWSEAAEGGLRSASAVLALPPTGGIDAKEEADETEIMFSDHMLIQRIQKAIEYSIHDHHVLGLTTDAARPTEDNVQALASVSLQTRYARPGTLYDTKLLQKLAKEQGLKLALPSVPVAFIDAIVLKPKEKQRGMDRELVHRIIDWAKEMGRLVEVSLALEPEEEEFYQSLGFRRITVAGDSTMFYLGNHGGHNYIEATTSGEKEVQQQKDELLPQQEPSSAHQRQQQREQKEQKEAAPLAKQQQQPAPLATTPYSRSPTSAGAYALEVVQQHSQQTQLEGSCLLDFDLVLPWQEQREQPPPPPSPLDAAAAAAAAAWKQPRPQPGSGRRQIG